MQPDDHKARVLTRRMREAVGPNRLSVIARNDEVRIVLTYRHAELLASRLEQVPDE